MELILYGYSDGVQLTEQPIAVYEAILLIENQDNKEKNKDNYICFQIPKSEGCIQFTRITSLKWELDIPFYNKEKFIKAKYAKMTTRIVKDVVRYFFLKESPLRDAIHKENYSEVEKIVERRWQVELEESKE